MAHRPLDVTEGFRLGAYTLVTQIGRGGFAPVWLARELWGEVELRTVAIKLFRTDPNERHAAAGPMSSQGQLRILEEARALCRVEHPNIVRFYAVATTRDESLLGLVMEYVQGTSLDRRIQDEGKLPVIEAVAVGSVVASALAAVHAVGLVHRDVKPANVIESRGVYKLIDFGIASSDRPKKETAPPASDVMVMDDLPIALAGTEAPTLTTEALSSFSSSGTIGFIDPAASAEIATPSSDLYSLGGALFQCLTGQLPAGAAAKLAGVGGLKSDVLDGSEKAPSLALMLPDANKALVALVDSLLDPNPSKRPRSAESVSWELERIRREIAGRSRPLPPEEIGPFRGLSRFEEGDRDVYFGRAVEVAAALEAMRSRGLVALIGPSGSGKSSLARAGVLPAILDGELGGWPKAWDAATCTPLARPRESFARALEPMVPDALMLEPEVLVDRLKEHVRAEGRGVVILVDQLEELVTLATDDGREYAARLLGILGGVPMPGIRVIVAARRDLLDPLLALPELGRTIARGTMLVSPMSATTWGEVIDQALSAYGYSLEDEALRVELLDQLKHVADAMPLVQFALTQLWSQRDHVSKKITRAGLNEVGGIAGALERHAESSIAELEATGEEGVIDVARALLLELTTPQGTRATKTLDELEASVPSPSLPRVLKVLELNRLIIREAEGLTLAHEALLHWERLSEWVDAARAERELTAEVEQDARRWDRNDRDDTMLWKGQRALSAEELLARGARVSERGRDFVEGATKATAEARRSRDRGLRTRVVSIAAFVLLVVGVVFSGAYAQNDHQRLQEIQLAQNQAHAALVRAMALERALVGDHDAAELLFARSLQLSDERETRVQLLSERLGGRTTVRRLSRSEPKMATADVLFNPESTLALTWDGTSNVHLWDLVEGKEIPTKLPEHVSIAPATDANMRVLALVTTDAVLHVYDMSAFGKPDLINAISAPDITQVVIAGAGSDGRVVAMGSSAIDSWDLHLQRAHHRPDADLANMTMRRSADGLNVELVSGDTVIETDPTTLAPTSSGSEFSRADSARDLLSATSPDLHWRIAPDTDGALRLSQGHGDAVGRLVDCAPAAAIRFAPLSDRFVCLRQDASIEIWSIERGSGDLLSRARENEPTGGGATFLKYAVDGQRLLFARGGSKLFDADGAVITSMEDPALSATPDLSKVTYFDSDADDDKTIRVFAGAQHIWSVGGRGAPGLSPTGSFLFGTNLAPQYLDGKAPRKYEAGYADMAFSADGRTLAVAGFETNRILLLDDDGDTVTRVLGGGPSARVTSVSFGLSGQTLASGYDDGTVVVWKLRGGEPIRFHAHDHAIVAVAFTPAGEVITQADGEAQIRLWNGATGAPGKQLALDSAALGFAVSPRGSAIAVSSGVKVTIFGDVQREVAVESPVVALDFADDGARLALGTRGGDVRILDTATLHDAVKPLHVSMGAIRRVRLTPNAHVVVAAPPLEKEDPDNLALTTWTIPEADQPAKSEELGRAVTAFAPFAVDSRSRVASSFDTSSTSTISGDIVTIGSDVDRSFVADSLQFSEDGRRVIGALDDGLRLVFGDVPSEEASASPRWWLDLRIAKAPKPPEGTGQRLAFAPDGRSFAAIDQEGEVRFYRVDFSGVTALTRTLRTSAKELAYDGHVAVTAGDSGDTSLWDVATGERLAILHGDEGDPRIARMALAHEQRSLAVLTSKGTLRRYKLDDLHHVLTASADDLFNEASAETHLTLDNKDNKETVVPVRSEDSVRSPLLAGNVETAMRRAAEAKLTGDPDPLAQLTIARLFGPYATLQAVMRDHIGAVNALAFSPDGSRWVSASEDGSARLSAGTKTIATIEGQDPLRVAAFSPDDRFLLTGSARGDLLLRDARTGDLKRRLKGHGSALVTVSFSDDKHLVATASAGSVIVWDLDKEEPMLQSGGMGGAVATVAFEPNGRRLLVVSSDNAAIWDLDAMAASIAQKIDPKDPVKKVSAAKGEHFLVGAWSPDGHVIAVGSSRGIGHGMLRAWEPDLQGALAATGSMLPTLELEFDSEVTSVSFRDDSKLLAAAIDESVMVIDLSKQAIRYAFPFESARVGFAHGDIVVASTASEVRLWDGSSGASLARLQPLKQRSSGDRAMPAAVALSNEHVLTGFSSGEVLAWAPPDNTQRPLDRTIKAQLDIGELASTHVSATIVDFAPSPNGTRIAAVTSDGAGALWNVDEDEQVALELPEAMHREAALRTIAYSPDGSRFVVAATDGSATVFDGAPPIAPATDSGSEKKTTQKPLFTVHHKERVKQACLSPDGKVLATVSEDKTVGLWSALTGALLHSLTGHDSFVNACAFDQASARLATVASNGSVRVWDVATGAALSAPVGHSQRALFVDITRDGRWVASGGDERVVHIWNATTGALERDLFLDGFATSVRFDPAGNRLAVSTVEGTTIVWDVAANTQLMRSSARDGDGNAVQWSPDGRQISIASGIRVARVLDALTGALVWYSSSTTSDVRFMTRGRLASFNDDRIVVVAAPPLSPSAVSLPSSDARYSLVLGVTGALAIGAGPQLATGPDPSQLFMSQVGEIGRVAAAPDGSRFVVASHQLLTAWDSQGHELPLSRPSAAANVAGIWFGQFMGNDRVMTGGWDGTLKLFDAATGALRVDVNGVDVPFYDGVVSPSGDRIALMTRTRMQIRDADGELVAIIDGSFRAQPLVEWSQDQKRILIFTADTLGTWDATTGAKLESIEAPPFGVRAARWTTGGRVVIQERQTGAVRVWDEAKHAVVGTFDMPSDATHTEVSVNGLVAASSSNGVVRMWDSGGKLLRTIKLGTTEPNTIAFAHDGSAFAVGSDDGARVIEVSTGHVSAPCGANVAELHWSQGGGRFLANTSSHTGGLCSRDGKLVHSFPDASGVALSPDGERVLLQSSRDTWTLWPGSASADADARVPLGPAILESLWYTIAGPRSITTLGSTLSVVDLEHGNALFTYDGKTCSTLHGSLSRDGHRVGIVACGRGLLFDLDAPHVETVVNEVAKEITLSPSGEVATTMDNGIALWGADRPARFLLAPARSDEAPELPAFSRDGRWLTATTARGTDKPTEVDVWEVSTGRLAMRHFFNGSRVTALGFSDDGRELRASVGDEIVSMGLAFDISRAMAERILGLLPPPSADPDMPIMWLTQETSAKTAGPIQRDTTRDTHTRSSSPLDIAR